MGGVREIDVASYHHSPGIIGKHTAQDRGQLCLCWGRTKLFLLFIRNPHRKLSIDIDNHNIILIIAFPPLYYLTTTTPAQTVYLLNNLLCREKKLFPILSNIDGH